MKLDELEVVLPGGNKGKVHGSYTIHVVSESGDSYYYIASQIELLNNPSKSESKVVSLAELLGQQVRTIEFK